MATITFDTLLFATKADIRELELKFEARMAEMKAELV